jgi:hypothetical protein
MAIHALSNHFGYFFSRLNPSTSFEAQASSQYNTVKGLIEDPSGLAKALSPQCFLQGSYRQATAIHAINDIDVIALCHLWQPGSTALPSKKIAGRGDRLFSLLTNTSAESARLNQHAFSMPFSPESWPFTTHLERPSKRESPMFSGKVGRGERI